MAKHIDFIAASGIERVAKGEFYQRIRPGDLLFCSGRAAAGGLASAVAATQAASAPTA